MTIEKLVEIADGGYPDGRIQEYFAAPKGHHGDKLAAFIVNEIQETFDSEASDVRQFLCAIHALERAQADIEEVISAIRAREWPEETHHLC